MGRAYKSSIKLISLPEGLTNIRKNAFSSCYFLSSITIPTTVESIESSAFQDCRFEYINIPNSVVSLGERIFYGCENLTSVVLPNNITTIPNSLFSHCGNLTSVVIPNGVTSIGKHAFHQCTSLETVYLPSNITNIEEYAFTQCSNLFSVNIPNNVTNIGNNAFKECVKLSFISIPTSVTNIGEGAFNSCEKLQAINVADENPNYCSIDGVLFNKSLSILIQYPGGKQGGYIIPEGVSNIEKSAFLNSRLLSSISINNSLTTIKNNTFNGCTNLIDIFLGTAVKMIETDAFANCNAIENITCYSMRPPTVNSAFPHDMSFSTIIYVPNEYYDSYNLHDFWGLYDVRGIGENQNDSVNIYYVNQEGNIIAEEAIIFHFPEVPQVSGFTFIGWRPVATIIEGNTIEIEAVYEADDPSSSAAINISGDTQKLIRKGNVYILRGEKTYTLQGQELK